MKERKQTTKYLLSVVFAMIPVIFLALAYSYGCWNEWALVKADCDG